MKLREFRKLRRLSRAELGRQLGGVADVSIWRWETGRCAPQPAMISRIREFSDGAVTGADHAAAVSERNAALQGRAA